MAINQTIKDAWSINDGMNTVLLLHLSPEMLTLKTPDNNWSIAGYLAHMAASKKWWGTHLEQKQKEHIERLPDLYTKTQDQFVVEKNLETIKTVFAQTSKTLLEAAQNATNKGSLPYASLDLFLIHMLTHDAHHRGQIFLILRAAGHPPSDEDEFWGGWWPEQQP